MSDRVYVLIEDHVLTTLQADIALAAAVMTFDAEGTKEPEDYNENELPAIVVQAEGSAGGEDPIAIGGLEEAHYEVTVFVVTQSSGRKRRRRTAKNITGRVETVMRKQYGDYQMSDLDEAVANAESGSVVTEWQSTEIVDNAAEGHQYRAVARSIYDLQIDINVED